MPLTLESAPAATRPHPPGLPPAPSAASGAPSTPSSLSRASSSAAGGPPYATPTVSSRHTLSASPFAPSHAYPLTGGSHLSRPGAPYPPYYQQPASSLPPARSSSASASNGSYSQVPGYANGGSLPPPPGPRAFPTVSYANGRHRYTAIPGAGVFSVPERYSIVKVLGQGSFGTVIAAYDSVNREHVAIKKCAGLLAEPEQAKRVLRSVRLMRLFNHPNVLGIRDLFLGDGQGEGQGGGKFDAVYIVMEQLHTDLYKLICARKDQGKAGLSPDHIAYFIYQILRGVHYIHSAGVLHRDLKPDNVLTDAECRAKICDFDFARGMADSTQATTNPLSDHVQTRMYRAPEVLLGNPHYSGAVDVWSVGCILAEMLRGNVLFPGKTQLQMMHIITDLVYLDPEGDFSWVAGHGAREYVKARALTRRLEAEKLGRTLQEDSRERLRQMLPAGTSDLCIEFLESMLAFDPQQRWTAQRLLQHPYLAEWHRPATETQCAQLWRWKWDSREPAEAVLYQLWWKEIGFFARHAPGGRIPHVMSPSDRSGVSPKLPAKDDAAGAEETNKENLCRSPASPAPPPYSPPAKMPSPPKFSPPPSPLNAALSPSAQPAAFAPLPGARSLPPKLRSPLPTSPLQLKRQPLSQISPQKPSSVSVAQPPQPSPSREFKPLF